MAAPMWRMNGLWRRMAGLLLLCALLLSNEVMCQEDQTAATNTAAADPAAGASAATDAPGSPEDSHGTSAPSGDSAPTVVVKPDSNPSAAPSDPTISATIVIGPDSQDGGSLVTDAPAAPAAPAVVHEVAPPSVILENPVVSDRVPHVECVKQEDIQEGTAVMAEVETDNCEVTKRIIEENPAKWGCHTEECNLQIFQDGNTILVATTNAKLRNVADVLMSEPLKDRVGVKKAETPPSSSSGSSVFVGILVTGLLAALAITVGYFKCQRKSDGKGVRLAEEAYPVDQENQGNTLVSVAPLNPPPETPEKPSVNGESPEAAKTQPPPPTNGHSTAKTADTEL